MSIELANELWISGKASGLLGQFASTRGYSQLIEHAQGHDYPLLAAFFDKGVTDKVGGVRKELAHLIRITTDNDVASTAKALRDLAEGEDFLVITNGGN